MTDTTTTTRSDALRALAERVEAGENGREIDRDVLLATGRLHIQDDPKWVYYGRLYRIAEDDGSRVFGGNGDDILIRPVSSSLDAVAALQEAVLPGWRIFQLRQYINGGCRIVLVSDPTSSPEAIESTAPTEPAARLAACLRALAMEAER